MSATKVRKAQKVEAPKRPSVVVPLATVPRRPTRDELLAAIEPPLLKCDDILIVGKHAKESERLVLSGSDLAHVLSLASHSGGAYNVADSGDVNLRLRGLARLIMGHCDDGGDNHLDDDAAYFLVRTLEDLAAKLEASAHVDQFSVFLRKKDADTKAGAA